MDGRGDRQEEDQAAADAEALAAKKQQLRQSPTQQAVVRPEALHEAVWRIRHDRVEARVGGARRELLNLGHISLDQFGGRLQVCLTKVELDPQLTIDRAMQNLCVDIDSNGRRAEHRARHENAAGTAEGV
eukprot:scaffold8464_cov57-Phaeocystis_antarctica.AAC.5